MRLSPAPQSRWLCGLLPASALAVALLLPLPCRQAYVMAAGTAIFSADTAEKPGATGFEAREYEVLEKGLFGRNSQAVQNEVMEFTARFKRDFGEEAFNALLDRYTRTSGFQEKAIMAYELQSGEEARDAYAEIEILSRLIPETFSRWKRLARDARQNRRLVSRDLAETVKSRRDEADGCLSELKALITKHNRLVSDYNTRYLGGVEFYPEIGTPSY